MKIRISTLTSKLLHLKENLSLENLNDRMNEGRDNDIIFLEAPQVDLTVERTPLGADTKGTVKSRYKQPCARCNEDIVTEVVAPADIILHQIPEEEVRAGSTDYEDDIGISFFEGDSVDLEPLLQEALILTLSRYKECDECKANAQPIQENDEPKNSLAALLQKAGVKPSNN